ncbi:MAG: CRISPR-associated DxTHG motif protein [Bacteroidaceae bacterium]|nr:CRISPR-associated DxTHG motif protein [Bacteroidaceae bacterium]
MLLDKLKTTHSFNFIPL